MAETLTERVFRAGFSDGWTANQTGRLAAPAAVDEAWHFYVADGALQKSVEATPPTPATDAREAAFNAAIIGLNWGNNPALVANARQLFGSSLNNSCGALSDYMAGRFIDAFRAADAAISALAPIRAAEILAAEARATALLQYAVHHDDCDGRLGPKHHCRCGLRALQHPSTETK